MGTGRLGTNQVGDSEMPFHLDRMGFYSRVTSVPKPRGTSSHQHTMKDEWKVIRKQFSVGF
jgi:hypothetical protein